MTGPHSPDAPAGRSVRKGSREPGTRVSQNLRRTGHSFPDGSRSVVRHTSGSLWDGPWDGRTPEEETGVDGKDPSPGRPLVVHPLSVDTQTRHPRTRGVDTPVSPVLLHQDTQSLGTPCTKGLVTGGVPGLSSPRHRRQDTRNLCTSVCVSLCTCTCVFVYMYTYLCV